MFHSHAIVCTLPNVCKTVSNLQILFASKREPAVD